MRIQELERELADKLPEQLKGRFQIRFQPQVNLSQGHFSADTLIRQASLCHFDPYKISKDLVSVFGQHSDFNLVAEQGFLNLYLRNIQLKLPEIQAIPGRRRIYLPTVSIIKNNSALLRLFSGAVLQTILTQKVSGVVDFYYGENLISQNILLSARQQIIDNLSSSSLSDDANYTEFLIEQIRSACEPLTLWFSPDCLPKSIYSRFYENNFKKAGRTIVCPPKLYLHGLELHEQQYFLALSGDPFYRALINLAGPAEIADLSLLESNLAVKANLIWYVDSLLKRLPELPSDTETLYSLNQFTDLEQQLIIYSVNLPAFIHLAIENAAIRDLLAVTLRLADGINYYFNSPDLRRRLFEKKLSQKEISIITVVRQALSAIYPALMNFDKNS